MDEPLSNLDAKLRNQMRAEIIKIHQQVNTTFIYVTHDQTEAMTLGDRIVIMKDGTIQQIGTPFEVFEHPVNLFVAGFIGAPQMNFFEAKLNRKDDTYSVSLHDITIELTGEMNALLIKKDIGSMDIKLGIRPEHLRLAGPGEENALLANMDVSEMMGSEMYLHLTVNEQDVVIRTPTIGLDKYYTRSGERSKLAFSFPRELIHLFSAEDETNLLYPGNCVREGI